MQICNRRNEESETKVVDKRKEGEGRAGASPYDNEKENLRILTNKKIYASVKEHTMIETITLNILRWFGHVQRMEGNRIPKRVLYMNLGTTRLRGGPRNR
jgi:hypothetical protein